jgi:hypothetical protein
MTDLVLARTQTLTAATALTQIGSTVYPAAAIDVAVTGSGASMVGAILAIVGLDADGEAQNENLAIASVGTHTSANTWSSITSMTPSGIVFTGYSAQVTFDDTYADMNPEADTVEYETLSQLRRRMMIRLGYGVQADNPPPGMAITLTEYLQSAQRFLFKKFKERRLTRFFTWVMDTNERFYTLANNQDLSSARLDPYDVEWVGISDNNQSWMQLVGGIPPEYYSNVNQPGLPARYEINQAVEVLPAPDRPYRLRVKGGFKLGAFTADADTTSIDSELVFLWALANAKNHYGHNDAKDIASQAQTYLGSIVAGKHGTNRYIPGSSVGSPAVKPRFLPLEE